MKRSIELDEKLVRAAEGAAAVAGQPVSVVIEQALRRWLADLAGMGDDLEGWGELGARLLAESGEPDEFADWEDKRG